MIVKKTFAVDLELKQTTSNKEFRVIEGDTGNIIQITLTDEGSAIDLTGCRVIAVFSKTNGTSMQDSAAEDGGITIGGTYNNQVSISLFPASFAPGLVECELQIYSDDSLSTLVTTAKYNFYCDRAIFNADTIQATNEYPLLVGLIDEVNEITAAEDVRVEAEEARASAEETRQAEYLKWVNADGVAETLAPGNEAEVEIVEVDGHRQFIFRIPKGQDGTVSFDELTEEQKKQLEGKPGEDGKTPEKGVDYGTPEDVAAIVDEVLAALPEYGGEIVEL